MGKMDMESMYKVIDMLIMVLEVLSFLVKVLRVVV